jgi:hypothetical protein
VEVIRIHTYPYKDLKFKVELRISEYPRAGYSIIGMPVRIENVDHLAARVCPAITRGKTHMMGKHMAKRGGQIAPRKVCCNYRYAIYVSPLVPVASSRQSADESRVPPLAG